MKTSIDDVIITDVIEEESKFFLQGCGAWRNFRVSSIGRSLIKGRRVETRKDCEIFFIGCLLVGGEGHFHVFTMALGQGLLHWWVSDGW